MKKLLILFSSLIIVLCMAGCGEKQITAKEELVQLYAKYGFDDGSEFIKAYQKVSTEMDKIKDQQERRKWKIGKNKKVSEVYLPLIDELSKCSVMKENRAFVDNLLQVRKMGETFRQIQTEALSGQILEEDANKKMSSVIKQLYAMKYNVLEEYYIAKGFLGVPGIIQGDIFLRGYTNDGENVIIPMQPKVKYAQILKIPNEESLKPNGKFILFTMGILNNGNGTIGIDKSTFALVSNDGKEYKLDEDNLEQCLYAYYKQSTISRNVNSGAFARCNLLFDIPKDKVSSDFKLKTTFDKNKKAIECPLEGTVLIQKDQKRLVNVEQLKNAKVGDIIRLGVYKVDKYESAPIAWRILDNEGDKKLLITENAIDCKPYHNGRMGVTWKQCSLRKWLNEDFYNNAFSENEKKIISKTHNFNRTNYTYGTEGGDDTWDKVFCLSFDEVSYKYFKESASAASYVTEYAKNNGAYASGDSAWWWLRSPGKTNEYAVTVNFIGSALEDGDEVTNNRRAVRPAVWVKISDK